jgi:hypothetical protein
MNLQLLEVKSYMMMLLPSCRLWNNEAMFPRLLSWDMCPLSCHHRCHCLVSKRRRPVGWVNRLDRVTICVRDVSSGGKNVKTVIYIWLKGKWYKFYIMDAMPTSKRRRSSYQKSQTDRRMRQVKLLVVTEQKRQTFTAGYRCSTSAPPRLA